MEVPGPIRPGLNNGVQARADRGSSRSVETRTEFFARPRLPCNPGATDLHNDPRGGGPAPQRFRPRAEAVASGARALHGFRSSSRASVRSRGIDARDAVQRCKEFLPGEAVFFQDFL